MSGSIPSRFPGFSAVGQARHWDAATRELVLGRLRLPDEPWYFSADQMATLTALVARLVDVDDELARNLAGSIDARIAAEETDGWHYDDMPVDEEVWTRSFAGLDADAGMFGGVAGFAALPPAAQMDLLTAAKDGGDPVWHGLPRGHLWNLWMRYACTAYYAHPHAWDEMGWPGPAYPRGYKNPGIDAREPFEVADVEPHDDPTRPGATA